MKFTANANPSIANRLRSNKDFEPTTEELKIIVNNMCSGYFTKSLDFPDNNEYINNILNDENENHVAENWIGHSNQVSSISNNKLKTRTIIRGLFKKKARLSMSKTLIGMFKKKVTTLNVYMS
ncbi:hypothetical protein BpHYR1_029064 [Brachionus plicatilis]|uniref:Uncharacterized protein n=1 Tax=Brachionus plicatilis TaxID=10195 RepID=A0A3M7QAG4_BRAPC|nr:hypothetical protein BpHYR1_029064 [Brachionus plicatilis]